MSDIKPAVPIDERETPNKNSRAPNLVTARIDIDPASKPKARLRKPSRVQRAASNFLGDTAENVIGYIFMDVLIPAAKDLVRDMVTEGIGRLLYGDDRRNYRSGRDVRSRKDGGSIISYGSFYNQRSDERERRREPVRAPGYSSKLSDISFASRADATEVLDFMYEFLEKYDAVSIADFYELSGLASHSDYTDNNWGWTDLSGVKITVGSDGARIKFPQPERIK